MAGASRIEPTINEPMISARHRGVEAQRERQHEDDDGEPEAQVADPVGDAASSGRSAGAGRGWGLASWSAYSRPMVRVEWRDRVVVVTIDRPERRNAVDHPDAARAGRRPACGGRRWGPSAGAHRRATGVLRRRRPDRGRERRVRHRTRGCAHVASPIWASPPSPRSTDRRSARARSWPSPATCAWPPPPACSASRRRSWAWWSIAGPSIGSAREFGGAVARAMLLSAQTYTGEQLHAMGAVHRIGGLAEALTWADETRPPRAAHDRRPQAGARRPGAAAGRRRAVRTGPGCGVGQRRRRGGPHRVPEKRPPNFTVGMDFELNAAPHRWWRQREPVGLVRAIRPA